mmetsp:Transcript_95218/g.148965  ORF Transcript_95218/g.148965 Transcript_95218/m.148965 type:complete len:91 (-) Transcript_95218:180-452(-)
MLLLTPWSPPPKGLLEVLLLNVVEVVPKRGADEPPNKDEPVPPKRVLLEVVVLVPKRPLIPLLVVPPPPNKLPVLPPKMLGLDAPTVPFC